MHPTIRAFGVSKQSQVTDQTSASPNNPKSFSSPVCFRAWSVRLHMPQSCQFGIFNKKNGAWHKQQVVYVLSCTPHLLCSSHGVPSKLFLYLDLAGSGEALTTMTCPHIVRYANMHRRCAVGHDQSASFTLCFAAQFRTEPSSRQMLPIHFNAGHGFSC